MQLAVVLSKHKEAVRPACTPTQMLSYAAAQFVVVPQDTNARTYLIWANTGFYAGGSQNRDLSNLTHGFDDWQPLKKALAAWRKQVKTGAG